jgi:hypothetical protein
VWFQQLESNPTIATKVIYFTWTLSRNWGPDSLRLFYFLPYSRAHGIASNHFKCTRDDWALAIRGLALTYGALHDDAFQDIFQRMHSEICNGQIGHSFSFAFLEAYTSDMFYRLSVATRTPTTPTHLPGNPVAVITADYTPRIWAQAFMTGFNSITAQFNSPLSFQTYTLRRQGQAHYPFPSHKPVRANQPRKERDPSLPARDRDTSTASGAVSPPGTSTTTPRVPRKLCFMSFLRHYKITLKSSNEIPKKCETTCKRLHYTELPKDYTRMAATTIAQNTTLVTEENRTKLIAAIAADKKYK